MTVGCWRALVLVLLYLAQPQARAEPLNLAPGDQSRPLTGHLAVLPDPTGQRGFA